MDDTIWTLSELHTLLAPNQTGDLSPQTLRDMLATLNVQAEMYRTTPVGPTNLGTSYVKLPFDIPGTYERGFVVNLGQNRIEQTPCDIKADISVEVHVAALSAGGTVTFAVHVNGLEVELTRRIFTSVSYHTWTVGVELEKDDVISVQAKCDNTSTSVTVDYAVCRATRRGFE